MNGGAVAVVVGVYIANSIGQASTRKRVSVGRMSVQDSVIVVNQSNFTNCSAASLTDTSLGTSSVFGGAFSILHAPQVSNFRLGVLESSDTRNNSTGFDLSVLISKSLFSQCSATSNASSGRLDEESSGGGAVYAKSAALASFGVMESTFNGNYVIVEIGSSALSSFSSGGALAVEAGSQRPLSWCSRPAVFLTAQFLLLLLATRLSFRVFLMPVEVKTPAKHRPVFSLSRELVPRACNRVGLRVRFIDGRPQCSMCWG